METEDYRVIGVTIEDYLTCEISERRLKKDETLDDLLHDIEKDDFITLIGFIYEK